MQRKNQIAIRAGQQPRQHLHHRNARPQRRIHRTKFQPDVSAANHQQTAGDVFKIEPSGRIHQARRIQLKRRNDGRPRTRSDNSPVETANFLSAVCFADPQRSGILKPRAALNDIPRAAASKGCPILQ